MLNHTGLNTESTSTAMVPQELKSPPQSGIGDTPHSASIMTFDGDRPRKKNSGTVPRPPKDQSKTRSNLLIPVNPESRKIPALQSQSPTSSGVTTPSDSSRDHGSQELDDIDQHSNPNGEDLRNFASSSDPDRETESQLAGRIKLLWSQHKERSASAKLSRDELRKLRDALSIELHEYKARFVGVGRDGKWAAFLREREIPVSTADKYVKRREDALARIEGKLLPEELPPTAAEITKKVMKLAPGLIRFLRGREQGTQFIQELEAAIQAAISAT